MPNDDLWNIKKQGQQTYDPTVLWILAFVFDARNWYMELVCDIRPMAITSNTSMYLYV